MNTQIYEEASEWIVKNREGELNAAGKKAFDAWLRQSPQHVRAYLEMSSIWEGLGSLDPVQNAAPEQLIARARAHESVSRLDPAHKASLASDREGNSESHESGGRPGYAPRVLLAASILLAAIAVSGWLYVNRDTYSTGLGEQRSIVLRDGSTIELNSRTRVRVRFSATERDVDLLEGQALFHVAKNPTRPFIVSADQARVRAVGTQFDVYKKQTGTVVTVLEGRVAVFPEALDIPAGALVTAPAAAPQASVPALSSADKPHQTTNEVFLDAGEQVMVTPKHVTAQKHANVAAATAWTQRNLVFDSAPLTDVAEEFNRYNVRQLVIDTAQLADFHVSGVFSSVDPALLLKFLRTQPELVVQETDREIRISKK
jgi:transmembrane sensor